MRFYFDYISPYAYLAWTQIGAIAEKHGREVEPVPILFAGLLNHWGHKGPAEIPPKKRYVFKDIVRRAHRLSVPIKPPPGHPFNPLLGLRVTEAAPAERKAEVVDALYAATWARGVGITDVETMRETLAPLGLSELVDAITPDIKAAVKANTEDAVAQGVFGVPTILVDGEAFWGTDSLEHLDSFLAGNDPLTDEIREAFDAMPIEKSRKA